MASSRNFVRFVGLCGICFLVLGAAASRADDASGQLWLDYGHRRTIAKHWELQGAVGVRTVTSAESWSRFQVGPALRWHPTWSPIELRGGVGGYYTVQDDAPDLAELRPWIGGVLKWPRVGRMTFASLIRVEDRIEWDVEGGDQDSTWRLRYLLSTRIPLHHAHGERYFFIPMSAEAFLSADPAHDGQVAQKIRVEVGIGLVYGWDWVAELYFGVQDSRVGAEESFDRTDYFVRLELTRTGSRDYMSTAH